MFPVGHLICLGLVLLLFSRPFREHALTWLLRLAVAGIGVALLVSWLAEHVTTVFFVAVLVLGLPAFLAFRRHKAALERLFPQTNTSLKRRRPDA